MGSIHEIKRCQKISWHCHFKQCIIMSTNFFLFTKSALQIICSALPNHRQLQISQVKAARQLQTASDDLKPNFVINHGARLKQGPHNTFPGGVQYSIKYNKCCKVLQIPTTLKSSKLKWRHLPCSLLIYFRKCRQMQAS